MTGKVSRLTIFKNNFSQTGRIANNHILSIQKANPDKLVYQRNFKNGVIGILMSEKSNTDFLLINKDGILASAKTKHEKFSNKIMGKLYNRVKCFYEGMDYKVKEIEKSVLHNLNTGKIEESAMKNWHIDGPVDVIVSSKPGRMSQFPVTKIAKNIHPRVAEKYEKANGDIVYWEHYLIP